MTIDSTAVFSGMGLAILCAAMLFLAVRMHGIFSPYRISEGIAQANTAMAVSFTGYVLGMAAVMIGAMKGPTRGFWIDFWSVGGYSILGMLLLNVAWWINDKIILRKFNNVKEVVLDKNAGTGAVEFGSYNASGLIVAGAIHGEGGGVVSALVFFTLGQGALVMFTELYDRITPYDLHGEIEKDNVAAGVATGGAMTATGIILMKGAGGDFVSWSVDLAQFGATVAICMVMLPAVRYLFQRAIVPGVDLSGLAHKERNLAAGLLEAALTIGLACVIYFAVDVM